MDKIFIDRLMVRGIIGVNESRRELPQEIVISVCLFTDVSRAGGTDEIADCVDYQSVVGNFTAHAERKGRYTVDRWRPISRRSGSSSAAWSEFSFEWRNRARPVLPIGGRRNRAEPRGFTGGSRSAGSGSGGQCVRE